MFDLSLGKLFVLALLALFLLGPERLPQYALHLARWVRVLRGAADDAKQRLAAEMGPDFQDVDWARLDPRRYHPRRLLTDAWNASDPAGADDGAAHEPQPADPLDLADARAAARTADADALAEQSAPSLV